MNDVLSTINWGSTGHRVGLALAQDLTVSSYLSLSP